MRWIYLLALGCHVKASDANQLKVLRLYMLVASLKISIDVLQSQMKGLPFQTVICGDLANPVEKHATHLRSELPLFLEDGFLHLPCLFGFFE